MYYSLHQGVNRCLTRCGRKPESSSRSLLDFLEGWLWPRDWAGPALLCHAHRYAGASGQRGGRATGPGPERRFCQCGRGRHPGRGPDRGDVHADGQLGTCRCPKGSGISSICPKAEEPQERPRPGRRFRVHHLRGRVHPHQQPRGEGMPTRSGSTSPTAGISWPTWSGPTPPPMWRW